MRFHRHGSRGLATRRPARLGAAVAALCAGAALAAAPAHAADSTAPSAQQTAPQEGATWGKGRHRMGHGGPGMMIPGMMHPGMLERMADELALSPEQRQTIRGFFDAAKPGMRELTDKLRANAKRLMDVTPDDPKYSTVVQQASQEAGALTSQLIQQSSQVRAQVYGVLTAEQKKKLAAKQAEMQKRRDERREERRSRRDGAAVAPPAGG